jgi:hypothetical protein
VAIVVGVAADSVGTTAVGVATDAGVSVAERVITAVGITMSDGPQAENSRMDAASMLIHTNLLLIIASFRSGLPEPMNPRLKRP